MEQNIELQESFIDKDTPTHNYNSKVFLSNVELDSYESEKGDSNKIKRKYILLILSCFKYTYKAEKQKELWVEDFLVYCKHNNIDMEYFYVLGTNTPEWFTKHNKEYEFYHGSRSLHVNTPDDYISLPKKVIKAYKAIHDTYEYEYIFKVDDDQVLTNFKLFSVITNAVCKVYHKKEKDEKQESHIKNYNYVFDYGGQIVEVKQPYLSKSYLLHPEMPKHLPVYATTYCSGPFYFLSREGINYLLKYKKKEIEKEYFEDYAIGYHLHEFYKKTIMNIDRSKYFRELKDEECV
jgi:hypothetical protein